MTIPDLKPGVACLRKKETDKLKVEQVDDKAIMYADYQNQIDMYGSKWNVFVDRRGWTWYQQDTN